MCEKFGRVLRCVPFECSTRITKPLPLGAPENLQLEHIPFGRFGIDDMCAALMSTFHNIVWQSGPHFDVVDLPKGWIEFPYLVLKLCPSEMKRFRNIFGIEFFDAIELQK